MNLQDRFITHWKQKGFQTDGQAVLLAMSGGIDSMVLAGLLLAARVPFAIAHCNFHLRDKESDEDAAFVAAWCHDNGITCFKVDFDTAAISNNTKAGIQETARRLRYEWFEKVRQEHGFQAVLTAHHADDNAETMIMNLCRGTGIAGLHGIPERNGSVIRPLLFALRQDIAGYAAQHNINYREDSSNKKDSYLRNALRHHIMPLLEKEMPGAALRIRDTSEKIREAEIIYRQAVDKERARLIEQRGNDFYVAVKLLANRKPIQTICYELFKPFGFIAAQTPDILSLLTAESGRYIASASHRIIRNRDFLIVTTIREASADMILIEDFAAKVNTANGIFQFKELQAAPAELGKDTPQVAFIDLAKMEPPLILRRWKTGDYFYPLGMGMKKKKLSRFLIDQKVPLHEKQNIMVLESNKRIVWIAGYRLDERFKVTAAASRILKVTKTDTAG